MQHEVVDLGSLPDNGEISVQEDHGGDISISKDHVVFHLNGKHVEMQAATGYTNASQVLAISSLPQNIQKTLKRYIVENSTQRGAWITFEDLKLLSAYLELSDTLQPLYDYVDKHLSFPTALPTESLSSYFQIFQMVSAGRYEVSIRSRDVWVNATHVLKAAGFHSRKGRLRNEINSSELLQEVPQQHRDRCVSLSDGLALCMCYGLHELGKSLETLRADGEVEILDQPERSSVNHFVEQSSYSAIPAEESGDFMPMMNFTSFERHLTPAPNW